MAEIVIDTNVLLVAEGKHADASDECTLACIQRLQRAMQTEVVVVDDSYRILGEYQHKLDTQRSKHPGTVFLKWLLQNQANPRHVQQVPVTEVAQDRFKEFPVPALEPQFDPPDRKFPAVANAHHNKPPILQAVDCKWLDWWPALHDAGVCVEFICPDDVCRFYEKKFPHRAKPTLPQ